ncbi:MAG: hypothetical protein HOP29_18310 [Phycisphaerales bacterium]|nr:hypothetical protein [Phycisphaerales bacterium]
MADEKNDPIEQAESDSPVDEGIAPFIATDEDKTKARKWFVRAAQLVDTKNLRDLEFAIKCFIDGLQFWPEAVDEAHQPLRAASAARTVLGGKKPGFAEGMKFSMTGKDARKAMLNAEWLLAHDPYNVSYMEGMLKNANRLRCEDTLRWIGPIYFNAIEKEKKLAPKRFALLREIYEEAGERCAARGDGRRAVECFEAAAEALYRQKLADPKNRDLDNELRDLSTKLTIIKGKYDKSSTFQASIRDVDKQQALIREERRVKGDEDLSDLIRRAEDELAETPDLPSKVRKLVDLLCARDDASDERRAMNLLIEKYKQFADYNFKAWAEDIRIKQLKRAVRDARESGDRETAKSRNVELITFEIKALRDRIKQYPTDNRLKFDLASRLFAARQYDEAIPFFQTSRADGKVRVQADLFLGRCFIEKGFGSQAIGTLGRAVESYEIPDDQNGKELRYWLARAYELENKIAEARETYGQILQRDYQFRDVRDRLERLRPDAADGA